MSKKIDNALRDLVKALRKHAEVASDKKSSRQKLQKAGVSVHSAATAYGSIVSARRGTDSPFSEIPDPRLDEPTVKSLEAERDAMTKKRDRGAKTSADSSKNGKHATMEQTAAQEPAQQDTVAL